MKNPVLLNFYISQLSFLLANPSYIEVYVDEIWMNGSDEPITNVPIEIGFISGEKLDTSLLNLLLYQITRFNSTQTTDVKSRYFNIYFLVNQIIIKLGGLTSLNNDYNNFSTFAEPVGFPFTSPDSILTFGTDPSTETIGLDGSSLAIYPDNYIAGGFKYGENIYAAYENNWYISIVNKIIDFFNIEGSGTLFANNVYSIEPDMEIWISDTEPYEDTNGSVVIYNDYPIQTDKHTENYYLDSLTLILNEVLDKLTLIVPPAYITPKTITEDLDNVQKSSTKASSVIWGEANSGLLRPKYTSIGYSDNLVVDPAYYNYSKNVNDSYITNKYPSYLQFRKELTNKIYSAGYSQKRCYMDVLTEVLTNLNVLLDSYI